MKSKSYISTLCQTMIVGLFVGCTAKTSNNVTDSEMRQLTETLFMNENLDFQNHVHANLQGHEMKRPFSDLSHQPLLKVDAIVLEKPLMKHVNELFDNYELDTNKEEIQTPEEHDEEEKLLNDLLKTNSINLVMHFLSDQGFIDGGNETHKNILRDLWFSKFSRHKKSKVQGSSAFEHIFLGELNYGRKLIGLHNWIFFNSAERAGLLNYWGHRRTRNLGNSTASIASVVFSYNGKMKSSTIFIGTSPELEISLYTLCYFVRQNKYCRVSMGGTRFGIQTYSLNHEENVRAKLGTAYPIVQ